MGSVWEERQRQINNGCAEGQIGLWESMKKGSVTSNTQHDSSKMTI